MLNQAHNTNMKIDTSTADPDHTLIPVIIKAQSITTHTEASLDHTIGSTEDMTGAAYDAHTHPLTNINPAMTHPTQKLFYLLQRLQ